MKKLTVFFLLALLSGGPFSVSAQAYDPGGAIDQFLMAQATTSTSTDDADGEDDDNNNGRLSDDEDSGRQNDSDATATTTGTSAAAATPGTGMVLGTSTAAIQPLSNAELTVRQQIMFSVLIQLLNIMSGLTTAQR